MKLHTRVRTALSVAAKVTNALNFYNGSFHGATGDISNITQFAIHCSIHEVTDVLYRRRRDYVFPTSREKLYECACGFARIAGFHMVQGAIDRTHVVLRAPHHNSEIFRKHKGFHSLNVCDYTRRILTVNARYPGSSHDAFILCQADSHAATRNIIEQTIGVLKQWFSCMERSGGVLHDSPEWGSVLIIVCFMLHNLAIMRAQPLPPGMATPPQAEVEDQEEQEVEQQQEDE
uniref:putative nuclease HARBI1 n=1 Tax=Pristiophorus japonicus TaxID=55135 RepID=UPI00398F8ABE